MRRLQPQQPQPQPQQRRPQIQPQQRQPGCGRVREDERVVGRIVAQVSVAPTSLMEV